MQALEMYHMTYTSDVFSLGVTMLAFTTGKTLASKGLSQAVDAFTALHS